MTFRGIEWPFPCAVYGNPGKQDPSAVAVALDNRTHALYNTVVVIDCWNHIRVICTWFGRAAPCSPKWSRRIISDCDNKKGSLTSHLMHLILLLVLVCGYWILASHPPSH